MVSLSSIAGISNLPYVHPAHVCVCWQGAGTTRMMELTCHTCSCRSEHSR